MENPYATPKAELIEKPQQAIERFERFSTWYVLGLTLVTFSVYYIYWLYQRTRILNQITQNKIGDGFIQLTVFLFFLSLLFSVGEIFQVQDQSYILMSDALGILSGIFELVWVFKFRNRLVDDVIDGENPRAEVGPVLTFFFQIFYLQYKINRQIDKTQTAAKSQAETV